MSAILTGKTAIITGASKGIGKATALLLSKLGANVVITYSSDDAAANELLSTINSTSASSSSVPKAIAVKGDAGDVSDIEALVKKTVDVYGKIDILICNAGVMPMADLEHTSEQVFDMIMKLNVKGPFFLSQKAAPHMAPGSHIIHFSTSLCAASTVAPPYLPYVTSKGAIEQMTRVMAKDLGRKGITVNSIAPGPTGTELFLKGKSEQVLNMIKSSIPFGRLGEPDDIAKVVAFLAGDSSNWVTGQVLRVNGGMA